jgi:hypothetical protein
MEIKAKIVLLFLLSKEGQGFKRDLFFSILFYIKPIKKSA